MKKRKRLVLGGLGAVLALLLALGIWWLRGGPRLWTQRQFESHQRAFAETAAAALAEEPWKNVPGVRNVNVWPKAGAEDVLVADFTTGGLGPGLLHPLLGSVLHHRWPARRLPGDGHGADGGCLRPVLLAGTGRRQFLPDLAIG